MAQRRIIESYGRDVGFTIEQLCKLIGSYKTLVDTASSINSITLANKGDVKDAIKRAREVGCIIDELIDALDCSICTWSNYMKLKTEYINSRLDLCTIETEVEEELRLQSGP